MSSLDEYYSLHNRRGAVGIKPFDIRLRILHTARPPVPHPFLADLWINLVLLGRLKQKKYWTNITP